MRAAPPYSRLRTRAKAIARTLAAKNERLVLAESCTGGAAAGLLTEVAGVSEVFCGSFVTYREPSKSAWIGVSARTLARESAVSPSVAEAMARGALRRTPEASLAAAITGYLGPSGTRVGLVYLCVVRRGKSAAMVKKLELASVRATPANARLARRSIAIDELFGAVSRALSKSHPKTGKRVRL